MQNIRRAISAFCILHFAFACSPRKLQHPNVLLITLDTFRADRITARTPNLLKLAESGTQYTQADAAAPLTLPSHATILSGVFPLHHGLRNNGAGAFPANRETLATVFSKAGYRTGAFVSAFVLDRRFGLARGFETYDDEIARDPNDTAATLEAERRGGMTVDRALAWLRSADPRPWFAWVHLYDAHAPYAPPRPYQQTYDGEVQYVDAQVGRLFNAIVRQKTIVVVVGDHGESLGEHGELTHGLLLYEATLHVPLIFACSTCAQTRVSVPQSTAMVAPKIASLAGLSIIGDDGIYSESEYSRSFGWSGLTAIREGNAKLIRGSRIEMFDLPNETQPRPIDRRILSRLTTIEKTAIAASSNVDDETKSKLAALGYVAPGVSATPSNRDPRDMAPLFRRYEEAQRTNAIAPLEQLVKEDPGNPVFRSTLGRAYKAAGAIDRAVPLYREAVALAPTDPDAWYNLAEALEESGKVVEAKPVATEAEKLAPNRPEAHNVLGIVLIQTGDAAGAEAEFRKAIELDPRNARSYNNIGNIYRITGRFSEAAEAYQNALKISPNYPDALNGLGVVAVQQGHAQEAIEHFDAALRIAPLFYEARLNRAIAMQIAGNRGGAAQELKSLLHDLPPAKAFDGQRIAARTLLGQMAHAR
jgi:choline-sulfatase